MFASAEKNTRRDNDCVIKTVCSEITSSQTAGGGEVFSAYPLVFVERVYTFGKETQQLSYVKAEDTSKSLRQQDEAKLLKYRNKKKNQINPTALK